MQNIMRNRHEHFLHYASRRAWHRFGGYIVAVIFSVIIAAMFAAVF